MNQLPTNKRKASRRQLIENQRHLPSCSVSSLGEINNHFKYNFRCYCKGCDNRNGKNEDRQITKRQKKTKKPGFAGELKRMKDSEFYANLGLKVIRPRWLLEESLLLFILLNREVSVDDLIPSNIERLQRDFNIIVNLKEVSQHKLHSKSVGQLKGKIRNFLQYLNIYDRDYHTVGVPTVEDTEDQDDS